jgi:DeoR/GlpR family transcriptional regulator of sugar metabolism
VQTDGYLSFIEKTLLLRAEKERIGAYTAKLIEGGGSIVLDVVITTLEIGLPIATICVE